jgi:predicted nuclease with RNAse H fold
MWIGIDYGAKKAGTTAACWEEDGKLLLERTQKGQDADLFLSKLVDRLEPSRILIDAPLSLPIVYTDPDLGQDYFYRLCDREIGGAMSPMFLGGLTARAMKLAASWEATGIEVLETWPRGVARELNFDPLPDNISDAIEVLINNGLPGDLGCDLSDRHMLDAVLAWWAGSRLQEGLGRAFGSPKEGLIRV